MSQRSNNYRGRGAGFNPPNRFEKLEYEEGLGQASDDSLDTEYFVDNSESILTENQSPDVPFTYSVNPYRGCEHGCIYCYARPTHEYLGFSSGTDFESKIVVKENAPDLLREELEREDWKPQVVCISGNTDPYQPVERQLEITRECLRVFLEYRNPVSLITKNSLITRDLDILSELAELDLVAVRVSITSLKRSLVQVMEPRTSRPERRLDAIEELSKAGVPVGVNAAPMIPGLTDQELPAIIEDSADRGATRAAYIMVRLPGSVKELFADWLDREFPDRKAKVMNQIRDVRDGELNNSEFGERMSGSGTHADLLEQMFLKTCKRLGLNQSFPSLRTDLYRRHGPDQMELWN